MVSKSFKPFVVSYGDEDLLLDRDLEKARQWVGRRAIVLDGELVDAQYVLNLCESYSEEPRAIIVDNAHKLKAADKVLKEYIENKLPTDTSVILVAIVRTDKKISDIWALAIARGKGYERKTLKPWNTDGYVNWIQLEATRQHVVIDKDVAEALLGLVGVDLYRLANEIKKLSIFVGRANRILKTHISLVTTPSPKADPFKIAELVMGKNLRGAMNSFSVLYKNEGDKCLVPVVYSLMRQVEKTVIIRGLQDKGVPEGDIAALVGMKDWPFKNVAAPVARKHEMKSLVRHMGQLCKLDADVKGPARSKRTLVELTMLAIAQ